MKRFKCFSIFVLKKTWNEDNKTRKSNSGKLYMQTINIISNEINLQKNIFYMQQEKQKQVLANGSKKTSAL